jgi:hypothetical protein
VRTTAGAPEFLTCRAIKQNPTPIHTIVGVHPVH